MESALARVRKTLADLLGPEHIEVPMNRSSEMASRGSRSYRSTVRWQVGMSDRNHRAGRAIFSRFLE
jgi:hypothetical protein